MEVTEQQCKAGWYLIYSTDTDVRSKVLIPRVTLLFASCTQAIGLRRNWGGGTTNPGVLYQRSTTTSSQANC